MTISSSDRVKFLFEDDVTFSMIITEVQASDAGKYTVTAVNRLGENKSSAMLTIKGRLSQGKCLFTRNVFTLCQLLPLWHNANGDGVKNG